MFKMSSNLRMLYGGKGLQSQLLHGGLGSIAVQIANVGLGVILAIALARSLGPTGYGVYAYVFALVSLLAIPAQFGLPALVVRETAKAEAGEQWAVIKGLWRWAAFVASALALVLGFISIYIAYLFLDRFSGLELATFAWGLVLVPLIALGGLRGAALRGLRRVVQGQLPEQLVRPGLLLLLVFVFDVFAKRQIRADQVMGLHVVAAAVAFAVGASLLRRESPKQLKSVHKPTYEWRRWLISSLPLALIGGMSIVNTQTDVVMLGIFTSAREVGIYRVAALGASLVSIGFAAIGAATMPHFARLHSKHDMSSFQRLATLSTITGLVISIPILVAFIAFGSIILRAIFGSAFAAGHLALVILGIAQLLNVSFGMVGHLLNMTGHERDTAKGMVSAAVCNLVLNAAFIPLAGIDGAATATALSMLVWNVLLWRVVRVRLGVDSSALSIVRYKFTPARIAS